MVILKIYLSNRRVYFGTSLEILENFFRDSNTESSPLQRDLKTCRTINARHFIELCNISVEEETFRQNKEEEKEIMH